MDCGHTPEDHCGSVRISEDLCGLLVKNADDDGQMWTDPSDCGSAERMNGHADRDRPELVVRWGSHDRRQRRVIPRLPFACIEADGDFG